jgi:hypothetical protein
MSLGMAVDVSQCIDEVSVVELGQRVYGGNPVVGLHYALHNAYISFVSICGEP